MGCTGKRTGWYSLKRRKRKRTMNKDTFLWQTLEELDGFDGVLLPQDLHKYIIERDGSCPYTIEELEVWLHEESESPEREQKDVEVFDAELLNAIDNAWQVS